MCPVGVFGLVRAVLGCGFGHIILVGSGCGAPSGSSLPDGAAVTD